MENESVVAKGLCERIGIEGSKLTHQPSGKDKFVIEKPMPTHKTAIEMVMEALQDADHGVIKDTSCLLYTSSSTETLPPTRAWTMRIWW